MTKKEVENLVTLTLEKWADIVLQIGKAYREKKNLDKLVSELLHDIYAFNQGDVLFKPTLAKHEQFRSKKEEFVSYFLGQNNVCKEDTGFAIKNWKSIKFENYKVVENNDNLLAMGNYFFENDKNEFLKVEYTFGFIRINNNELRINLHHSSLPYSG
jgi:hypothetical protein|tara:strand:- start:2227 stop:2697 length:471 start_codon:yes stop_codon:yes gene_type:complete